jgi:GAF domain-containing protein
MNPKVEESLARMNTVINSSIFKFRDQLTDELCALTASEISYIAAVDIPENTLTMVGWSQTAMKNCAATLKPIVYNLDETGIWGDAVRERQAVITNDYQNLVKPTKRGYPAGHVHVIRHMNLPIFEGKHIAAVIGVGNKEAPYTQQDADLLEEFMNEVWPVFKEALWQATW